jgi:hypothetical protein
MERTLLLILGIVLLMVTIETGKALSIDTKANVYKIVMQGVK